MNYPRLPVDRQLRQLGVPHVRPLINVEDPVEKVHKRQVKRSPQLVREIVVSKVLFEIVSTAPIDNPDRLRDDRPPKSERSRRPRRCWC